MIDFESMYSSLTNELSGNQRKINIQSAIGVYYGLDQDGNYRIAFLSSLLPPKIESTKVLRVTQGEEALNTYWTCFDLLQNDAKKVFFAFCSNLIESITGINDEAKALKELKKRYITWKSLFKNSSRHEPDKEVVQGLFGELYFLKNYMFPKFGTSLSVNAWSGPDSKSKDFAIDTEWFELKTVGANTSKVHISSLAQLSSKYDGHLVIIRVEGMSDQFTNGESSIGELFVSILEKLNDELIEGLFISKLASFGFELSDATFASKFDVKSINSYRVDDSFPRLTEAKISRDEICDVSYSLIINSLTNYREETTDET